MTAQELYDLVKDWPREAWPSKVDRHGNLWTCDTLPIPLENASLMFEASGLRWLIDHENTDALTIIPAADHSAHYRIEIDLFRNPASRNRNDRTSLTFDGPTLIHAISAAIAEHAKGETK